MKLIDALHDKKLRLVEATTKGWPKPYKDQPWFDPDDLFAGKIKPTRMALVNASGKFWYVSSKDYNGDSESWANTLNNAGISSAKGTKAIFYNDTGDQKMQSSRSKFLLFNITPELLNQEIINLSQVKIVQATSWADIAIKIVKGEELTPVEAVSFAADMRTVQGWITEEKLFSVKEFNTGLCAELINGSSDRALIFKEERHEGIKQPKSIALFNDTEKKLLKNSVVLS